MNQERPRINYLLLLLIVIVGVLVGNLLTNWVTAKLLAYRAEQALAELSKSAATGAERARDAALAQTQKAAGALASRQSEVREQRRRDRQGVRLAQACAEWRAADAQLHSETTGIEMRKHCGIYDRYVEQGVLPSKN